MARSLVPLACVLAAAAAFACNDHPVTPLAASLSAAVLQTVDTPPVGEVDFLFVVDDSGSMAEEQASLALNFARVARFLRDGLGGRAHVRVAVTDTDLRSPDRRGAFITPTSPDCAGVGPILSLGPDSPLAGASEAEVARQLGCLTTLGTRGSNREKGLEAMRLALSCEGPNAAAFGACCVPGPDGRSVYDRGCTDSPAFLRPQAKLVVVFLTDEDDCSDPAANPAAATRALCRTGLPESGDCEVGEAADACRARHCDIERQEILAVCRHGAGGADAQGIPAAYGDAKYCPGGDRAACFAAECAGRTAADCHAALCGGEAGVPGAADALGQASLNTCQWFPDVLTPVEDYRRFLTDLKRDPRRQLVLAAFTGTPKLNAAGEPVYHSLPWAPTDPACEDAGEAAVPDAACCPGGRCEGPPAAACDSDFGRAGAGTRYLALAEAFEDHGLGCLDPVNTDHPERCVSLCEGDLAGPLEALLGVVSDLLRCWCLDAPPREGTLSVRLECPDGRCSASMLPDAAYSIQDAPAACAGGSSLCLDAVPPPGTRVMFSYGREIRDIEQP